MNNVENVVVMEDSPSIDKQEEGASAPVTGAVTDGAPTTPAEGLFDGDVPAKPRGRKPLISDQDFVKLWNSSASMEALVERALLKGFGAHNKNYFSMRATALRKQGVAVKKFPRGRRKGVVVLGE